MRNFFENDRAWMNLTICTDLVAVFADTCREVVAIDWGRKDDLSFATTERHASEGKRSCLNLVQSHRSDFGQGSGERRSPIQMSCMNVAPRTVIRAVLGRALGF